MLWILKYGHLAYSCVDNGGCGLVLQSLKTLNVGSLHCPVEYGTTFSIPNMDVSPIPAWDSSHAVLHKVIVITTLTVSSCIVV